jgi:hypothetical protein
MLGVPARRARSFRIWSGLAIVFGAAAVLLGRIEQDPGRGLALSAVIIGAVAVVADLVSFSVDRLLF